MASIKLSGDLIFQEQLDRLINKQPLRLNQKLSPLKRALLITLEKGLGGQTIYQSILDIESEAIQALTYEMELHAKRVPLKMLAPLFLFLFPAFSVLLYVLVTQTILL